METVLADKYLVATEALGRALGEFYQCPYVPYSSRTVPDVCLLRDLNVEQLRKAFWLPWRRQGNYIDVLIDNPHDLEKGREVRRAFPGLTIRYAVSLQRDIEQFLLSLESHMGSRGSNDPSDRRSGEIRTDQAIATARVDIEGIAIATARVDRVDIEGIEGSDSYVVDLINQIIREAHSRGASDIHIEPSPNGRETVLRLRVDGTCSTLMKIPFIHRRGIVSRIKIMASLDIAERRKPQDGKIRFDVDKENAIELRVATIPTAGGNEDVVLRLLTAHKPMPLEAMDFSPDKLESIKELTGKPHGIILCVGPTGSGKTTTLHAILSHLNSDARKIWTAEDPIEITQEGLRQVQVHPKIGFTFAAALRSFLRADPDIIMIGEMRDKETTEVAIDAALTGHLVLSTLHTNSAVETVARLLNLGCDPFNLADAMVGVLAQRLCKRICSACRESYTSSKQEHDELASSYGFVGWESLGVPSYADLLLYRGRGCEACNGTGFKGRVAIHELLIVSDPIRDAIQSRVCVTEILNLAMQEGMTVLMQDGIHKVLDGLTTLKQVRSVTK
jgi:type II secretory ATPase GspE/PulE/Tfp pilus assembly ATPase PilB-like protein